MDFFLKNDNGDYLRLPVPPPDFTIQRGNLNQSVTVTNIGELNLWGPEKLAGITLQSFFPYTYNAMYCSYQGFPKPWDCIKKLNDWRLSGNFLRLIITDKNKEVDINMQVLIESLDSNMQDASGDVYFVLVLKEYRVVNIQPTTTGATQTTEPVRPAPPAIAESVPPSGQRTYTVVYGDTLWGIAKRYYGNGSKYPDIASANPTIIKDPNVLYPGWTLIIP